MDEEPERSLDHPLGGRDHLSRGDCMCRSTASLVRQNEHVAVAFEVITQLDASPERAFDLSLDVDAHTGSMAKSRERAIRGVTSGGLGLRDEVTWRARHFGLPWTMTSKITELDRPRRFVDEQVAGPFASFRHEHLFEPYGGGTRMIDRVTFTAPVGVVGRIAERILLARYLEHLIRSRNAFLRTELSAVSTPRLSD